jgi:hypothetical protein
MSESVAACSNDLMDYLIDLVRPLLDEKGIVIWYDRYGALEQPLREAASRQGWAVAPGAGPRNALAARVQVEKQLENDGLLWSNERKWIVYQRGERRDPSWYEDIELIGRKVQKTLAEIVAERHGLPAMQVAALINERTAQRLIENWDRVFPNGTWSLDLNGLSSALLSLAFDETGPMSPKSAVLRFLSDPSRLTEVLQSQGLGKTFVHVIRTQLGFGRLAEGDTIKPSVLVRAMMASELVHKKACEYGPSLHNYLPQKNSVAIWSSLAESAVKDPEARLAFQEIARQVESETHLVQQATELRALAGVMSISSVDDRLLEEVAARCQGIAVLDSTTVLNEIGAWAEERLKLNKLGIEVAEDWLIISNATRLIKRCRAAVKELAELLTPNVDTLVAFYADPEQGWWRLDDLHRGLELRFGRCRHDVVSGIGKPAVKAYWAWAQQLASRFAAAFEASAQYVCRTPGTIPHTRFWSELVDTGNLGETAVLFVDALRIDLAESLRARLDQPNRTVYTRLALASLPSKTPVGMASLLPRADSDLIVLSKNGKLRSDISGKDVSAPAGRIDHLRSHIANIEVGELKAVSEDQLRQWASNRMPVALMTRDIDDSGEIAASVAPELFEEMVADLARSVTVLHRAGYRRVVIGTDHGFLLIPADIELPVRPSPGSGGEMTSSTRYSVGPNSADADCIGFQPSQMGRTGTSNVVLPKGLTAFGVGGPRHRFVHGGLSPQECVLRFVVSELAGPQRIPVRVRLSQIANVSSMVLFVPVEVTTPSGPAAPRRISIEARAGNRPIGRSEPVVYKPESELVANETYPKIKVLLTQNPPQVNFVLIDEDSGDILDELNGVQNVMRREDEDDLI